MAIILNDVSARNDYVASAGQTVFPLTFKFFATSDLLVYQNGALKTLTTHYTVAGAGADTGMAVTLVSGAALSDAIAVVRAVPYERTTQLPLTGPFPVAALNTFLSKLVSMVQQVRDRVLGAIVLDVATNSYFDALSKRIANVATPTVGTDAANKSYVDASPAAAASAAASQASAVASAASASNASGYAVTAVNALAATLAAYDSFDDRYLGAKASDPTLDNDGNALIGGTLYFNSVAGEMRIWTGSAWVAAYVSGTTFALKTANLSDLASLPSARTNLGLGSAAVLTAGVSANSVVQLDGAGKLPAVDGSQLTGVSVFSAGMVIVYYGATAPTGWLKTDGTYYNVSTYPTLAGQIGTVFNSTLRGGTASNDNASDGTGTQANGLVFQFTNDGSGTDSCRYTADDGATWTAITGTSVVPYVVGYQGSNYFYTNGAAILQYSANLTTWTTVTLTGVLSYAVDAAKSATYSYLPAQFNATPYARVYFSTNGSSWTSSSIAAYTTSGNAVRSIVVGAGVVVAVGATTGVAATNAIHTSPDNSSPVWTSRTVPSGLTGVFASVSFANGTFFAVTTTQEICTSTDGTTWTKATVSGVPFPYNAVRARIAYWNGMYFTRSAYSANGLNWTTVSNPFQNCEFYPLFSSNVNTSGRFFGNGRYIVPFEPTYAPTTRFWTPIISGQIIKT